MSLDFDGPIDRLIAITKTALSDTNSSDLTFTVLERCRKTAVVWTWSALELDPDNLGLSHIQGTVTYSGLVYVRDLGSPTAIFEEANASVKKIATAITDDMTLNDTVDVVLSIHGERNPLEARLAGGFTWYPYTIKVTTWQQESN